MHLDDLKPLLAEGIQVRFPARQGGGKREALLLEAIAMTIAALGAINRWAGVKWQNRIDANGRPIAIAIIPGVRFVEQDGRTILDPADIKKE